MMRAIFMLLLFLAIMGGMVALSRLWGREVTMRWKPNPTADQVTEYRVYRGLDLLAATSATTAFADVETGDELSLFAVNTAGLSDPALHIVPAAPLDRAGWVATASSAETVREDNKAANAVDNNTTTIWHTTWGLTIPPHYLRIELPRPALLSGLRYLPRQDGGVNGIVTGYEIQTSLDGATWAPATTGTWPADATPKRTSIPLVEARYVRLWGSDPRMAAAEVGLEGSYVPLPPQTMTLTYEQSDNMARWETLSTVPPIIVPKDSLKKFIRLKSEPTQP